MIYLQLFWSFVKIGLLGFGGGMAIIGLIQNEVERYGWMSSQEFVDIFAISQMTPGPIGVNCATYVGYTATGSIFGSVVATGAIILPSLVIMLIISNLYFKISAKWSDNRIYQYVMLCIKAIVIYLIGSAAYHLMDPDAIKAGTSPIMIDNLSWIIFGFVFYFTLYPVLNNLTGSRDRYKKDESPKLAALLDSLSHPILLIVLSGLVGLMVYLPK